MPVNITCKYFKINIPLIIYRKIFRALYNANKNDTFGTNCEQFPDNKIYVTNKEYMN